MKMTFRWFGPKSDTVSLENIKQIPGMTGVMGFLDYKEAGELWTKKEINDYVKLVRDAGLECEVIESVNVHEDIKMGLPSRDKYIDNYIQTIRNLADAGVKVIIYNFMPVLDWLRTDLGRKMEDGSFAMYYDESDIGQLGPVDIVNGMIDKGNGFSLPGYTPERVPELKRTLQQYASITKEGLLKNYKYFLDKILPVCEECGVKMAVHPDDPGWDLFGLPRVGHSLEDLDKIMKLNPSPANTICLCTGSIGSDPENDVPAIIRYFGSKGRISCLHVRNIKHLGYRRFTESAHKTSEGSLDMYEIMKAVYDTCPDSYIRPDHGRMIWGENGRPGYGLYDRALGCEYLEGLWEAISHNG